MGGIGIGGLAKPIDGIDPIVYLMFTYDLEGRIRRIPLFGVPFFEISPQAALMKRFRWTYSISSICFTPTKTAVAQIIWRMWFQDFDSTHKGFWYHILLSGVQHIDGKGKNSIKRILLIYSLRSSPHAGFSKAGVIYTGKRTLFSVMDPLPQGASKCGNPLPTRNIW